MQAELKQVLNVMVQQEFSKVNQHEEEMTKFLQQFGLPQSLHSLTSNSDIPDAIWNKIQEF